MVKVFTTNKNGKVEFTEKELENLLNEVWRDGYNSNINRYWWSSPNIATGTTTAQNSYTTTNGSTITYATDGKERVMACPVYPIIVWHPYPKEKPKEHKQYLVTVLFNGEPYVDFDDYFSHGWDDWKEDEVMAWAEKPLPYEPHQERIEE